MPLPAFPASSAKQAVWDAPAIPADKTLVSSSYGDSYHQARLSAVFTPHSSDWLHALSIACGLRLDNEAVRVAVGLRLGVDLCTPHDCPCGKMAGARGSHGLSCRLAFGSIARHYEINDVIWRALCKANVPSVTELSGLVRVDGKLPDGSTFDSLALWQSNGMGSHCSQYIGGVLSQALCQSRWHSRTCRVQKICKIFITSTFTYIPTFGFGNTWTDKFY